jgi:hypothetical protein
MANVPSSDEGTEMCAECHRVVATEQLVGSLTFENDMNAGTCG